MERTYSISGGHQGSTANGLKMQYSNLLKPLLEQFWTHELTCAPGIIGNRYEESPFRLLYVGRAVNGWEADWKKGTVDELVEQVFAHSFKMASIAENPIQNGYNFNRSPFWQLCRQIMKLASEDENWSDRVMWSNLYKVAPYKTGNPDNKLIKETIAQCIKILTYEIMLYRPTHIVFVTDDWWFDPSDTFNVSFAKTLDIPIKHNTDNIIVGKGIYHSTDAGDVKIVVTKRPEGLGISREQHAKVIFDALESLD